MTASDSGGQGATGLGISRCGLARTAEFVELDQCDSTSPARGADQRSVIRRYARRNGGLRLRLNPPYELRSTRLAVSLENWRLGMPAHQIIHRNKHNLACQRT